MRRIPLFDIFYNTTFSILSIILIVLLLITPSDAIRQALNNNQLYNAVVVSAAYLLTLILALLIYASRIYGNHVVLAGIPKTFLPIEKGDVGKNVRKVIADTLTRSVVIAYDARPRNLHQDTATRPMLEEPAPVLRASSERERASSSVNRVDMGIPVPLLPPIWGPIAHRGWSSPSSPDLPNLNYDTVILELPNLIEAKAVSLAPTQRTFGLQAGPYDAPSPPDARAVSLLQRPAMVGLRDYITYLTGLDLINPPSIGAAFLDQYERARFSMLQLTEDEFRSLMRSFAEILRGMAHLSDETLQLLSLDEISTEDSLDDDDSFRSPDGYSPSHSSFSGTIRTAPSRRRVSGFASPAPDAVPSTPPNQRSLSSRAPSANSPHSYRPPFARASPSSFSSRSASSVIQLSMSGSRTDLPYTLILPP
ncbi:MAG: hypothetical protein M1829_003328 [Trizodia sp. TS-e1964]|nr:MAG: hypothetical protein M1829_003328 [Trizodia sp. TS-e1964]